MLLKARTFRAAVVVLTVASATTLHAASTVNVYLSAPYSQTAGSNGANTTGGFANTSTEDFTNNNTTGTYTTYSSAPLSKNTNTGATNSTLSAYATGTTSTFSISAAGQYGGGGQGSYLGISKGGETTLTFGQNVGYFGLEWCAVDSGNSLSLYDQNNALIGTFNAATFQSILPKTAGSQITAVNGTKYDTVNYYGQPKTDGSAPTLNTGEQYAFLNFVANSGTTISKITLTENSSAVFESDNHAILTTAPTVNSSSPLVFVSTVPEPSTVSLFAAAGVLMFFTIGRRRQQN